MLMRLLRWIKNHPIRSFLLILFFPVYGFIFFLSIAIPIGLARDWYYEKFPFSALAVRLFAEPGEDTLMFRYRLGDRLLYVRSDIARPARYSGREKAICNPLWGECRVFPLEVPIYKEPETGKICINRYPDCSSILDVPYAYRAEFVIYPPSYTNYDGKLEIRACNENYNIFTFGRYRDYFVDRVYGHRQTICPLVQPDGGLDSLLTAMETGNYDKFPRNRKKVSAD
jgi:hypothetical protein